MDAELKIRAGAFWRLWSWGMRPMFWQQEETSGQKQQGDGLGKEWPWKGLFGRSSTSELLKFPVTPAEVPKVLNLLSLSPLSRVVCGFFSYLAQCIMSRKDITVCLFKLESPCVASVRNLIQYLIPGVELGVTCTVSY